MKKLTLFLVLLCCSSVFAQQSSNSDSTSLLAKERAKIERLSDPIPREFQFIGYSFFRSTASNITPTNEVLQGQVIGRLFGPNSTEVVSRTAVYTEQRFVPYMVYQPAILDGFATFRGLFKIDYTWGDNSYGVGNNRGGGLSGGQVNLQTLMANVSPSQKTAGGIWYWVCSVFLMVPTIQMLRRLIISKKPDTSYHSGELKR